MAENYAEIREDLMSADERSVFSRAYDDFVVARLAEAAASLMLEHGIVRINTAEPFKLASGILSPLYVNCREVLSDASFIGLFAGSAQLILQRRKVGFDLIAGGESAGIPFAAFLARQLNVPMVYVRKATKDYGIKKLVEGGDVFGKRALLVEDLITDAGSKLHFISALRAAGATVENCFVLFDRRQGGAEQLAAAEVTLHSLTDLKITIEVAEKTAALNRAELAIVKKYLANPEAWLPDS